MTSDPTGPAIDPFKEILGLDLPAERLEEDLKAYADILVELRRLRALDLTDVHPAVVFDPAAGFAEEADG